MKKIGLVALSIGITILYSCDEKQPDINWNYDKNEIVSSKSSNTDKLNVDLYLDVTTSMKGFTSTSATNFSALLDDVEAVCQKIWKNSDVRRFKYGAYVKDVD